MAANANKRGQVVGQDLPRTGSQRETKAQPMPEGAKIEELLTRIAEPAAPYR